MAGLKGLGKVGTTAQNEADAIRKYLEQFAYIAPLNGQSLSGSIPNAGTFVLVRHSLGRAYTGAFLTGVSTSEPLVVQSPAAARAGGTDISKYVVVFCKTALSADTTFTLWVF